MCPKAVQMTETGRGSSLTFRRALPADADAMAACFEAAYAPACARGVDLPPISEGLVADVCDHLVWVADDSTIRGGIVLSLKGDVALLINLAVDPTYGGRGIGKQLIEQATEHARRHGAKRIDLTTHVDMPENVEIYRHLGWRETGREANKVRMSRDLDEPKAG